MIALDYRDARPLYEQIADKFQTLILKGVLEPNSRMPSVRSLAVELSINPNTIQRAYSELERMGFLYTAKGRGGAQAGDLKKAGRAGGRGQGVWTGPGGNGRPADGMLQGREGGKG